MTTWVRWSSCVVLQQKWLLMFAELKCFSQKHPLDPEFSRLSSGGQTSFPQILRRHVGIVRIVFVKEAKHLGKHKAKLGQRALLRAQRCSHIQTLQRRLFSEVMYREVPFLQRSARREMRHRVQHFPVFSWSSYVCSHRNRRCWSVQLDHLNVLCSCGNTSRTLFLPDFSGNGHWKHLIRKRSAAP